MWTWTLEWGRIRPDLVIGTCPMTPADLHRIQAGADVSALLSLQHDDCLAYWDIDYTVLASEGRRLGLAMVRCPIRDFDICDMRRRLPAAVSALAGLQAEGHRTYVHCTAGLGRAPLTVLGYLTLVEGQDPEEAIRVILAGRAGAVPSWEAYHGCCDDLAERHREAIERRAYALHRQGLHGNADDDWRQARAEILREVLSRPPLAEWRAGG